MSTVKEEAREVVNSLPDDATWSDVLNAMYEMHVRQSIAAGIRDAEEGRVVSHEEVRRRFGLR